MKCQMKYFDSYTVFIRQRQSMLPIKLQMQEASKICPLETRNLARLWAGRTLHSVRPAFLPQIVYGSVYILNNREICLCSFQQCPVLFIFINMIIAVNGETLHWYYNETYRQYFWKRKEFYEFLQRISSVIKEDLTQLVRACQYVPITLTRGINVMKIVWIGL